jgi:tyrosyl-DNA phosphodiesterase-1
MDWGVHHTKMFLVGYERGLRVVVHTSNLRASDLANNAQSAYVQDFPPKAKFGPTVPNTDQSRRVREHCDGDDGRALSCPFEEELVRYLDTYRQTARYEWPLDGNRSGDSTSGGDGGGAARSASTPLRLTEVLRRYDYSAAYGVLVPSVPGYHRLRNCPWGHLRLRDVIRAHACTSANNDDDDDDGDENSGTSSNTGNILLQFSSLGSISLKWLHELASSMDVRAARAPLRRLPTGAQSSSLLDKVQIIWPTFEEVRTAAAGYAAGGPIPGRTKNTDKSFLRRFYHRWSSSSSSSSSTEDPMRKRRHPGHCKTFLQLSGDDESTATVEWCLVTSHNLSTAALGQIQNNSQMGEQCLFIRHWELGVFVSPDTLKNVATAEGSKTSPMAKKFKNEEAGGDIVRPGTDASAADKPKVRMVPFRGVDAKYADSDVILPLPFDVKPTRYSSQDVPWATDRHGGLPDAFGRVLG